MLKKSIAEEIGESGTIRRADGRLTFGYRCGEKILEVRKNGSRYVVKNAEFIPDGGEQFIANSRKLVLPRLYIKGGMAFR